MTMPITPPLEAKTAPERTCSIPMEAYELAQPTEDGNEGSRIPIKMRARSKDVLAHWFWGNCYHDFDGMQFSGKAIIDYDHRDVIGYFEGAEITDYGLVLSGYLTPVTDTAREVIALMQAGVPMQASINFGSDALEYEWIPENATTEVNGAKADGPVCIFRKWDLRGVAVCPYGYDQNTESALLGKSADKAKEIKITRLNQEDESMTKPNENKDGGDQAPANDQQEEQQVEGAGNDQPQGDGSEQPGQETGQQGKPEATGGETQNPTKLAKKFSEEFGAEMGMTYLCQGMSIEDARVAHLKYLTDENTKLKQQAVGGGGDDQPSDVTAGNGSMEPADIVNNTELSYHEKLELARKNK